MLAISYKPHCDKQEADTANKILNHCGQMTPYGIGDLGQHWFR